MSLKLSNTVLLRPQDQEEMERAVYALEHASFAIRLAEMAGKPVSSLFSQLPSFANRRVNRIVESAILKCLEVAIESMDGEVMDETPSAWVPRVIAGVSGGLGGLFGAFALPVELPLTTMIMLRSIAEIAQSHGEDLTQLSSRLACLEVFALGGREKTGETHALTYYATRTMLTKLTCDVTSLVAGHSTAEGTTALTARVAATISSRFGPAVAERLAATAVPLVGLLSGATVNMVFMEHYQQLAHGHFTIRKLERRYGAPEIETVYGRIAAITRDGSRKV